MKLTVPLFLPLEPKASQGERGFLFSGWGTYQANPGTIAASLRGHIERLNAQGFEIDNVTFTTGGIHAFQTREKENLSWGYGVGTSATNGALILCSYEIAGLTSAKYLQILDLIMEIEVFNSREKMTDEKIMDKYNKLIGEEEKKEIKAVKAGFFTSEISHYEMDGRDYKTQADAEAARQRTIQDYTDRMMRDIRRLVEEPDVGVVIPDDLRAHFDEVMRVRRAIDTL
jgi:hypothetical protein